MSQPSSDDAELRGQRPAADPEGTGAAPLLEHASESGPEIRPHRVLLIEDQAFIADLVARTLEKSVRPSFVVETAGRLSLGLDRLAGKQFDIVLLDLVLPDSDGIRTFTQVHKKAHQLPIVVLTGEDDEELGVGAVNQGAQDYLVKGEVSSTALVRSLRYAIERHRMLTEIGQYAQELQTMEASLRNIISRSPDSILILDEKGDILFANRSARELFGWDNEDLVAELFGKRTADEDIIEVEVTRKDGTTISAEMRIIETEWHWRPAYCLVLHDITHLKKVEDRLRRSNVELQEFAYVVSHDLQEPLRMVSGFCDLLRKRYADQLDAKANEFIDRAVGGADRMGQLIQSLLAYSRVSTKAKPPSAVDTNAVLDRALDNLRAAIEENGVTVTRDALPTVLGDATQLGQVFQNLIENAIKFRDANPPKIHLSANRQSSVIDHQSPVDHQSSIVNHQSPGSPVFVFSVRDNGIGIEPQHLGRIFGVFQRLNPRGNYPGTGIGLAICKKVIQRHGGEMWVESQPGQGSVFHFTLAAAANAADQESVVNQ